MKIVHLSDTHGPKYHTPLQIPECDVLVHTGDIGGRTNLFELAEFLMWFEKQPAKKKIFIGGNHDIVLDKKFANKQSHDPIQRIILQQHYTDAIKLIEAYKVKYLCDTDYVYNGVKFYGSPYSPSFHRDYWAFNADRGREINKVWAKIPNDVDVLLTHTPVYGFLDNLKEYARIGEDKHVGCNDLLAVIKKRLFNLKLHCSGHIHDNFGITLERISNNRRVLFSNGAVMSNLGKQLITNPLIITI